MQLPLYHVDAFADRRFAGNPAAVVPLETWLPDDILQAIAAENNLSETAFLVAAADGWELRWFTPAVEVDLCGHATLASAWVIANRLDPDRPAPATRRIAFQTRKAGLLTVTVDAAGLTLDFPARPAEAIEVPAGLVAALGGPSPQAILAARDYLVVYDDEDVVRGLTPDFTALARLPRFGTIVTAPGRDVDFVSRFFAPAKGLNEDPVTGSSHCTLVPYWADRLGHDTLTALQVSARGGRLRCRREAARVLLTGSVVPYLEGMITV
ncbi:MAG: PhzF family phenazine biosynthesis protein [Azospirillaceae bacterium]|nr:PhzF family phenazine biosynthesis protein [Azospirillaceae bacterium]